MSCLGVMGFCLDVSPCLHLIWVVWFSFSGSLLLSSQIRELFLSTFIFKFLKIIIINLFIHLEGMCISITEADAIRISMHSQRYDTLKIHMKQLPMWCDLTMQCDLIWFNTMRFNALYKKNTMPVIHRGKQNVSNAFNSTNIFAVCHGGSIWFMIDIKGCLRISEHKWVSIVWSYIVVYNHFSPDWIVRLF